MKAILIAAALTACLPAAAQNSDLTPAQNPHSGFQASLFAGSVFGKIKGKVTNIGDVSFSGSTMHMTFQLGYALNNWSFGFAFGMNSMALNTFTAHDTSYLFKPGWSMDYGLTGLYVKRYFMPINIFASLHAGIGNFTMSSIESGTNVKTERGMIWELSAGKEFFIGKKKQWGIGGYLNVTGIQCNDVPPFSNDKYKVLSPGIGAVFSYH